MQKNKYKDSTLYECSLQELLLLTHDPSFQMEFQTGILHQTQDRCHLQKPSSEIQINWLEVKYFPAKSLKCFVWESSRGHGNQKVLRCQTPYVNKFN